MAPAVDAFSLSFHTSNECGLRYEHRTALVLLRILAAATPIPTCGLRCVGRERTELGQVAHGEVSSSFLPLLPPLDEWC